MVRVDALHNDVFVLYVHINTIKVRRVLIDSGSSSKIMYHIIFKKLDLPPSQVKSVDMPVFSFSGEALWPIVITEVPDRIGKFRKW